MAYTASYAMGSGGCFLETKVGRSVNRIFPVHLVPGLTTRTVLFCRRHDSSAGIVTAYGLDGRGSISYRGKRFTCTLQRPHQV
jgi:hypothetical protein